MPDSDTGAVIDRVFAAFAAGDLDAARACFAPDAAVWHGFDGIPRDVEATMRDWAGICGTTDERFVADVHRQATETGFVQQHLFVIRPKGGERRAWPVCIVVRIADGLIGRLDEYIDRAGSIVSPAELVTPGF